MAGRDPSHDLHAWVSGSDLEMMSAFRENAALSLGVRAVEGEGGEGWKKQTLTPTENLQTSVNTFMPFMSDS